MLELKKENHSMFKEFYTGSKIMPNGQRKTVNCILDTNCVRYIVFIGNRIKSRREFDNGNKGLCFNNATKALNK